MKTSNCGVVIAIALTLALPATLVMAGTTAKKSTESSADDKQATVSSTEAQESPFACDRLGLSPEARKRHFDELGPALRSLRKSVQENCVTVISISGTLWCLLAPSFAP